MLAFHSRGCCKATSLVFCSRLCYTYLENISGVSLLKLKRALYFLIFVFICLGTFLFLQRFAKVGVPFVFYEWQQMTYTDQNGNTSVLDNNTLYDHNDAKTDGYYTFTATVNNIKEADYIELNMLNCSAEVYTDDQLIYSCDYTPPEEYIDMNNIELPFPDLATSCKVTLVCRYHKDKEAGVFPPMLKVSSDVMESDFMLAVANYYAIPSGILAFIFIVICGIYLLGLAMGRPDHSLVILAFAAIGLSAYELTIGNGSSFVPLWFANAVTSNIAIYIIPAAVILYVILNGKKKAFSLFFFLCVVLSVLVYAIYYISSFGCERALTEIRAMLEMGLNNRFVHWLTVFVVTACALSSLLYHVFSIADTEARTSILKTQNEIARKSYDTLLKSFRQSSGLRHRQKSDMIALKLMYDQNKINELGEYLNKITEISGSMPRIDFSDNYTVNSIVQYAFSEAQSVGIKFDTDISVPDKLNISDGDLCTLLVNMLDNAVEACKNTSDEREKTIELRIKYSKGFLSVMCRNTCPSDTENKSLKTTKRDKLNHGFGMGQMESIAKKYNSLLDINRSNGYFTVQTSLRDTGNAE